MERHGVTLTKLYHDVDCRHLDHMITIIYSPDICEYIPIKSITSFRLFHFVMPGCGEELIDQHSMSIAGPEDVVSVASWRKYRKFNIQELG